jgi:transposase-like protein
VYRAIGQFGQFGQVIDVLVSEKRDLAATRQLRPMRGLTQLRSG